MTSKFRSVVLHDDLCKGCTLCVKRCPTEAIRVREGKAHIIKDRCIDCGECIRVCPEHAKYAIVDPVDVVHEYKHTIALPAPTLYGQFEGVHDIGLILEALRSIGFDEVFEVAAAAEVVSGHIARWIAREDIPMPAINSACPAVIRMISLKFPSLASHVIPIYSPMEYGARWARRLAMEKTGLKASDIGVVFISPCPAKVRAAHMSVAGESNVNAVVSIRDIYPKMLPYINGQRKKPVSHQPSNAGASGIGWCSAGGEAAAVDDSTFVAADGIDNVIHLLEDIEDGRLPQDVRFVELNACSGGCVGGVLTVESPFVARSRIKSLMRDADKSQGHTPPIPAPPADFVWEEELSADVATMQLDADIGEAMKKMRELKRIEDSLYGMDCGACGAPSCRALAEDIVRGFATEDLCIYRIREKLQDLLDEQRLEDLKSDLTHH